MASHKPVNSIEAVVSDITDDGLRDTTITFVQSCPPEELAEWRDPHLSINIFQLAVLHQKAKLVRVLAEKCPHFLDEINYFSNLRKHYDCETVKHDCETNESMESSETNSAEDFPVSTLVNFPLHLAFMVGNVDIIRYLFEKKLLRFLTQVSYVSVSNQNFQKIKSFEECPHGKPLDFAIYGEQTECVVYFLKEIIPHTFQFLYVGIKEPMLWLYKSCAFGLGPALKLLVKQTSVNVAGIKDRNGKTLLHVAVLNGDTDTIQYLLEMGLSVNATADMKGCLHILYRSKFNPSNFVANTKLLLRHGVNIHLKDDYGHTPLYVLVEEFKNTCSKWEILEKGMSYLETKSKEYSPESHREALVDCMELLLSEGADPNSGVSLLKMLLEHIEFQKTFQWVVPEFAFRLIELLLSNGAKTNVTFSSRNEPGLPLLTYFILHDLMNIGDVKMKVKFIHLFCCYDNDMINRGGNDFCYPLVSAVQKQMPTEVLEVILDYMDMVHLKEAVRAIKEGQLLQMMCSHMPAVRTYGETIAKLFQRKQLRSLKHCCKVVICKQLKQPVKSVEVLPLAPYLKNYIKSSSF